MMRDPTARVTGRLAARGSADAMNGWGYIGLHAAAAATFIFLLQRFVMNASVESSLSWAVAFGGCAAALAYIQSKR